VAGVTAAAKAAAAWVVAVIGVGAVGGVGSEAAVAAVVIEAGVADTQSRPRSRATRSSARRSWSG